MGPMCFSGTSELTLGMGFPLAPTSEQSVHLGMLSQGNSRGWGLWNSASSIDAPLALLSHVLEAEDLAARTLQRVRTTGLFWPH